MPTAHNDCDRRRGEPGQRWANVRVPREATPTTIGVDRVVASRKTVPSGELLPDDGITGDVGVKCYQGSGERVGLRVRNWQTTSETILHRGDRIDSDLFRDREYQDARFEDVPATFAIRRLFIRANPSKGCRGFFFFYFFFFFFLFFFFFFFLFFFCFTFVLFFFFFVS